MAIGLSQLSPARAEELMEMLKSPVPPLVFWGHPPSWRVYSLPAVTANWIIDWKVFRLSSLQMIADPSEGQPAPL